jgi:hypothetical protein
MSRGAFEDEQIDARYVINDYTLIGGLIGASKTLIRIYLF